MSGWDTTRKTNAKGRRAIGCAIVSGVLWLAAFTVDASASITAEALDRLVAGLDAEAFATREEAAAVLQDADWTPEQLRAVLERDTLSVEQRHRLLTAYEQRVLYMPRGALGVRMMYIPGRVGPDGRLLPGEIEITQLVEDMPASEVLLVSDHITHIDGQAPKGDRDLINWVQRKQPGDPVKLTVKRTRRTADNRQFIDHLEIEMTLGAAKDLNQTPAELAGNQILESRRSDVADVHRRYGAQRKVIQASHVWAKRFDPASHPLIRRTHLEILQVRANRRSVDDQLLQEWRSRAAQLLDEFKTTNDPIVEDELMQVLELYTDMVEPWLFGDGE